MPSTSKSKRRGAKKMEWRVKQPTRNWLELTPDVMANILHRIGAIDILENAQKVCTAWRKICKDPAMWREIDMHNLGDLFDMPYDLVKMCMHAVDRSEGQLVDINIEYFGTDELLKYITDRSSQLRRLQLVCCYGSVWEGLTEAVKKLPLLEELNFYFTDVPKEAIEEAGLCCPLLKSLKLNTKGLRHGRIGSDEEALEWDEEALAIAKNLPQLHHLQLVGNSMTNNGLLAILDGCPHLESLDLRRCFNISLEGSLGKRCSQQIKNLKRPDDSTAGYGFIAADDEENRLFSGGDGFSDVSDHEGFFSDELDYDDFVRDGLYEGLFSDESDFEGLLSRLMLS